MTTANTPNDLPEATAARLAALEAKIDRAARKAQTMSWIAPTLAIISTALIGYWLYYAHSRFTNEINPDLIANLAQSYVEQNLPEAAAQTENSLKDAAPNLLNTAEARLKALPEKLTTQFKTVATQNMDAEMPDVQARLYSSLRAGLAQADTEAAQRGPGVSDEVRFYAMIDQLAKTYKEETVKFVDQVYDQYTKASGNITANLQILAEGKSLTPSQQSQRTLVRDFLILAKEYDSDRGKPSSATQPVVQ